MSFYSIRVKLSLYLKYLCAVSDLKKTVLYQRHLELGAKMTAFAGYAMPVHYKKGIIKEHNHCREQAGFFDISHMGQILISGQSAALELEKLVPSDITGLQTGQQRYTVLINENGGIIDDIIITRTEAGFLIVANAACKDKDLAHFKQYLSDACTIKVLQDQALFALQGPATAKIMQQLSQAASQLSFMNACNTHIANIECFISRSGYTGEDGFEISISNQHAEVLAKRLLAFTQVAPIGLGARDTLRLEAGLSLYGHELNEMITPIEAGLKWIFRKNAANYLGEKTIHSQLRSGATKKRVGLIVEDKRPIREGCELFDSQDNNIGIVTSGSFSPSLGKPIALALLDSNHSDQTLYAKLRKQLIVTHITQLPFIPHHYQR